MTEQYISGYLEAVSRVKDIVTPFVGGSNSFFSIDKNASLNLLENLKTYLTASKDGIWFLEKRKTDAEILYKNISLKPISDWEEVFPTQIKNWTCDTALESINGQNGYSLSEYLVKFLLKEFFDSKQANLYKLLPDWGDWPWGDQMGEEFIFETESNIYIMHFGESS